MISQGMVIGGNSRICISSLAAEGVAGEGHRRERAEEGCNHGIAGGDPDAVPARRQQALIGGQRLEPDEVEGEGQLVQRRAIECHHHHHQDRQIEERQDQGKIGMGQPAHQLLPS